MVKCIYMLVFPNKKTYVGLTSDLKDRFNKHKSRSKKPKQVVHYAIQKYGWERVTKVILEHCNDCTMEHLAVREKHYIKHYGTYGMGGYNCTEGGEGTVGYRHTKKAKAAISRKVAEQWKNMNEQEKAVLQQKIMQGKRKSWKKKSKEEKDAFLQNKVNVAKKAWENMTEEQKNLRARKLRDASKKRAVRAISPEGAKYEFESCRQAAQCLTEKFGKKFDTRNISHCLRKRKKTHLGFRFEAL